MVKTARDSSASWRAGRPIVTTIAWGAAARIVAARRSRCRSLPLVGRVGVGGSSRRRYAPVDAPSLTLPHKGGGDRHEQADGGAIVSASRVAKRSGLDDGPAR